jgi:hypothetical protein
VIRRNTASPTAAKTAPPKNAARSSVAATKGPRARPPAAAPTSKNIVNPASTRARSRSLTALTAAAISDGYYKALPTDNTTVPAYRASELGLITVTTPPMTSSDNAQVAARPSPMR